MNAWEPEAEFIFYCITWDADPALCKAGLLPYDPSALLTAGTPTPPILGAGLNILPANFSGFALAALRSFLFLVEMSPILYGAFYTLSLLPTCMLRCLSYRMPPLPCVAISLFLFLSTIPDISFKALLLCCLMCWIPWFTVFLAARKLPAPIFCWIGFKRPLLELLAESFC